MPFYAEHLLVQGGADSRPPHLGAIRLHNVDPEVDRRQEMVQICESIWVFIPQNKPEASSIRRGEHCPRRRGQYCRGIGRARPSKGGLSNNKVDPRSRTGALAKLG